jgi:hypothetical protein
MLDSNSALNSFQQQTCNAAAGGAADRSLPAAQLIPERAGPGKCNGEAGANQRDKTKGEDPIGRR